MNIQVIGPAGQWRLFFNTAKSETAVLHEKNLNFIRQYNGLHAVSSSRRSYLSNKSVRKIEEVKVDQTFE